MENEEIHFNFIANMKMINPKRQKIPMIKNFSASGFSLSASHNFLSSQIFDQ
jgi:hypothetical protein